jgi:hypothetical protein
MALAWLAPCAIPDRMRLPLLVSGCSDVQSAMAAILREADEIIVKPLRLRIRRLQLDYITKRVLTSLLPSRMMPIWPWRLRSEIKAIDEFEIWLWLQMCGETDKPQWVAID